MRLESYPIAALTIREPGMRRRYSLRRLGFLKSEVEAGAVMTAKVMVDDDAWRTADDLQLSLGCCLFIIVSNRRISTHREVPRRQLTQDPDAFQKS